MYTVVPHRGDERYGVAAVAGHLAPQVVLPRGRTIWGHQNHRPSMVAMDGISSERTISVSSRSPIAMVEPICATTVSSLPSIAAMVNANTRPADVTTPPVPAMDRMIPVLRPGVDLLLEA